VVIKKIAQNQPLKSSLKPHCKPGPKSPTRCTSASSAAVPPTFLPFDSAVAFYKSLSSKELSNATFRLQIGELASALYVKDKKRAMRSTSELQNLCSLSKNEPAIAHLRTLCKSLDEPKSKSNDARNATNAKHDAKSVSTFTGGGASSATEDAVRFSASVQSQLYDVNAAPNQTPPAQKLSGGAEKSSRGETEPRRRSGDSKRRTSGSRSRSSSGPKLSSEGGLGRSKQRKTQRVQDRSRSVPSSSVEKNRPKGG